MAGVIAGGRNSPSASQNMEHQQHPLLENVNHRPPKTLQNLTREKIVEMALIAVNRIQTGLRNSWLGWPLQFLPNLPNFEPKVLHDVTGGGTTVLVMVLHEVLLNTIDEINIQVQSTK